MTENKPSFKFVAHRMNLGDFTNTSNNFIDNSLEALKSIASINHDLENLKGFECDVKLTKDGELVVIHDGYLKSVTPDKDTSFIRNLTFEELKEKILTDIRWYYKGLIVRSNLFREGKTLRDILRNKLSETTHILKASDMLDYLSSIKYKGEIIIELKNDKDKLETDDIKDRRCDALIELVNTYWFKLNIAVQSYDLERMDYVKEKTNAKVGALCSLGKDGNPVKVDQAYIREHDFDFYSLMWPRLSEQILIALIEEEKGLYTWTIDSSLHLLTVLNKLAKFKKYFGVIPDDINLITNIPLMLNDFINGANFDFMILDNIERKYDFIYDRSSMRSRHNR